MRRGIKMIVAIWVAGAVMAAGSGHMISRAGSGKQAGSTTKPEPTESAAPVSPGISDEEAISQIGSAEEKKKALEEEKKKLDEELDQMQEFTDNIQKYVRSIDFKIMDLQYNIDTNRRQVKELKGELEEVRKDFDKAQEHQQEQYGKMKAHVKYIYENSENSYLEYLMEAGSLADFFSREEYVEKVTKYDGSILADYQKVLNDLSAVKLRTEEKESELRATKHSLKYEKEKIAMLSEEKERQVKVYQGLIDDTKAKGNSYAAQIAEQQQKIEDLTEQRRAAIAAQEQSGVTEVMPVTGEYAWPLPMSGTITSPFGYRHAPTAGASTYHKGVDISVPSGTKVLATKEGKVVISMYSSSAGNYVGIYHGGGIYSYYMHCSSLNVSVGDKVKQGQVIARSGSTGISTGPHLHFAMFKGGNYVNPMYYVKQP